MFRSRFIKTARKDYPEDGIKAGESYWKWSFQYDGVHRSKTEPDELIKQLIQLFSRKKS